MTDNILKPILITGAARSGTSMTAGVFHACGAWGGELAGPTRYNKRGMFENAEIRSTIIKPMLKRMNCDPMGQHPLPDLTEIEFTRDDAAKLRENVIGILRKHGLDNQQWFYKGAKMCLIWPVWNLAFPDAKWIIVRRKPGDIVNSCIRTSFMRAFGKDPKGWKWWVGEHLQRFQEMKTAGLQIYNVWPQKMIFGDFNEIKEAIKWAGLNWNDKAVMKFIEPALWTTKMKKKGLNNGKSNE